MYIWIVIWTEGVEETDRHEEHIIVRWELPALFTSFSLYTSYYRFTFLHPWNWNYSRWHVTQMDIIVNRSNTALMCAKRFMWWVSNEFVSVGEQWPHVLPTTTGTYTTIYLWVYCLSSARSHLRVCNLVKFSSSYIALYPHIIYMYSYIRYMQWIAMFTWSPYYPKQSFTLAILP